MSELRKLRKKSGYTQADLSEVSGLSLRTIQRLESENKKPEGYTLVKLSEVFDMQPAAFQELFFTKKPDDAVDLQFVKYINLSVLIFVVFPFGNLILPTALWQKRRDSKLINELGKKIVNLQLFYWIVLCFLLSLSAVYGKFYFSVKLSVLTVLFIAMGINIIVVFVNAFRIHRKNFNIIGSPIPFL